MTLSIQKYSFSFLLLAISCQALSAQEFANGTDISSLTVLENAGAVYTSNGVPTDALTIFNDSGVNWHRLRIFVDPTGSDPFVVQDLNYTIQLAQRVKQTGAKLLLDFHYSDTWADPGKQFKPVAWEGLSFNQLEQQVEDYTQSVMEAFGNAGVTPEMVQIGNEINNGMIWDDGRLWRAGVPESVEFDNLANLVSAGVRGAKAGAPGNEPEIMIHHSQGGDWGSTSYYFDRLLPRLQQNNTDIDVIGYSYYPKFHYNPSTGAGGISDVALNLNNTVDRYDKSVMIVEAGFASRGAQYEPTYEYAVSPEGQKQFLQDVVDAVKNVPDNQGKGVFWWYPEARPMNNLPIWNDGRYGLFDENGEKLPALEVFQVPDNTSYQFDSSFLNNATSTPGSAADPGIYAQGFRPSLGTNPQESLANTTTVNLDSFTFYKSAFNDSASDIQLVILNNLFADVSNLSLGDSTVVGISSNVLGSTSGIVSGNAYTFFFDDLSLDYEGDYAAVFVNQDEFGNLTPIKVSAMTADYEETSPGSGIYVPVENYGEQNEFQYSTSNFINSTAFGDYFTSFSYAADARFQASFSLALSGLAGDFNNDGVVDLADYTVWRDHHGQNDVYLPNDSDGGTIGNAQYMAWSENFGSSTALSSQSQAVPEPGTLFLALSLITTRCLVSQTG